MANTNAPRGFVPAYHLSGSGLLSPKTYAVADNYTTAIYTGDPVKLTSGYVVIGTAGAAVLGIAAGFEYTVTATGKRHKAKHFDGVTGKTNIVALVYDDPKIVYEIQSNSNLSIANIGSAYDFATAAGSAITGDSGTYLDSSGDGFKVIGLVDRPDNAWGTYQKLYVVTAYPDHLLA